MRENISEADSSLLSLLHIPYDTVFLEKSFAGTHVRALTGPISCPFSTAAHTRTDTLHYVTLHTHTRARTHTHPA